MFAISNLFLSANCVMDFDVSHCSAVKKKIYDYRNITGQPIMDDFHFMENLYGNFTEMLTNIQNRFHRRIDYFESLNQMKPSLCNQKKMIDQLVSVAESGKMFLPALERSLGRVEYDLFPPIYDYTKDIKTVSNKIMENFKSMVVNSMHKMHFVVNPLLRDQISYLKDQVKYDFYDQSVVSDATTFSFNLV